MKKLTVWMLIALMSLTVSLTAYADKTSAESALDAFNRLTQQTAVPSDAQNTDGKTSAEYLTEVMSGMYTVPVTDQTSAAVIAPALNGLSSVTSVDIALYAGENGVAVEKVRNTYFQSLANVLRAEIMVNPASEERYRNVQLILSLFLYDDDTSTSDIARDAIRTSMTKEYAQTIATDYSLPLSFVEFVIMDDDWDDSNWQNDTVWTSKTGYIWSYDNTPDNTPDYTPDYTVVPSAAPAGNTTTTTTKTYTNTNTPDYRTPDYTPDNTRDYNTPDNTRDYNTPDNTRDYGNT